MKSEQKDDLEPKKNEANMHLVAEIDLSDYRKKGYDTIRVQAVRNNHVMIIFGKRNKDVFTMEMDKAVLIDVMTGEKITTIPKQITVAGQAVNMQRHFGFSFENISELSNNKILWQPTKGPGAIVWDCKTHSCVQVIKRMQMGRVVDLNQNYFAWLCYYGPLQFYKNLTLKNYLNFYDYLSQLVNPSNKSPPLSGSIQYVEELKVDDDYFKDVIYLGNNELAVVKNKGVEFYRLEKDKIHLIKALQQQDERPNKSRLFFLKDKQQLLVVSDMKTDNMSIVVDIYDTITKEFVNKEVVDLPKELFNPIKHVAIDPIQGKESLILSGVHVGEPDFYFMNLNPISLPQRLVIPESTSNEDRSRGTHYIHLETGNLVFYSTNLDTFDKLEILMPDIIYQKIIKLMDEGINKFYDSTQSETKGNKTFPLALVKIINEFTGIYRKLLSLEDKDDKAELDKKKLDKKGPDV